MKNRSLALAAAALAVTALVASGLACSSLPIISSTPTPTATATRTPTLAPTPSPAPTRSPTIPPTGRTEQRTVDNGSIVFTDHQLGYSLTLPPQWAIIDLQRSDLEQLNEALQAENPDLANLADAYIQTASDSLLFMAFDPKAVLLPGGSPSILLLVETKALSSGYSPGLVVSLMGPAVEDMIPNAKLQKAEVVEDLADFPVGWIEYTFPQTVGTQERTIRQAMVLFPAGDHYLGLVLASDDSGFPLIEPLFEDTLKSIQFSE